MADHLKDSGIKFDGKNLRVGRKLDFDGKTEKFVNDKEAERAADAELPQAVRRAGEGVSEHGFTTETQRSRGRTHAGADLLPTLLLDFARVPSCPLW